MSLFVVQPTRQCMEKSTHPEQLSSRVLNVRLVHLSFSQNCLFSFFLQKCHQVLSHWGWKVTILFLIHKAQSIYFFFFWKAKNKPRKVPFCFSMIFLNKNIQRISFMLITGMKQRFFLSFFPFYFKAVMLGLWLVTVLKFSIQHLWLVGRVILTI